jgi:hypothetical protein
VSGVTIRTVADVTAINGVKSLVYGASGAGKTFAIGSLEKPIIFSTEDGLLSLARDYPHLHTITISKFDEMKDALSWATSSNDATAYSHIVLDSFSDLAEIILADAKMSTKDGRKAYGDTGEIVLKICRMIRQLPRDVYMTAKEGQLVDGDGVAKFGPVFPGKALAAQVPYFFDEVFQLVVQTDPGTGVQTRWLRTAGDMQFVAKDRSGRLDPWEPANLSAIYTKIRGA